ncbi:multifunctional acyl-CoA thioesterase I and protease I and lysophospholipase L1 [Vibrio ruber DSM 16370]|uniref:Multifunctional acyl-CoA thioesterase I and protease I and lysophospholipase L1 n=1 Tax=Vibrio ruber (strain DSM 16370 / JCM 11486 / BCRC 17186 / CECT 7878 / LMG 23124 / VR1) TaxID=1123498 RepID=A0A1R4L857_VIBR1|nr:hypothetical protein [Vibrio ruber]SJN52708.1 multifunctional acyl-CoA thioesterase I and protease I and lysophospholipase L1 [Vibrio ruber DSM 16370]
MNWIKLISINLVVLIVLLLLLEGGARIVWTLKTCMAGTCNYSQLTHLKVRKLFEDRQYAFIKPHDQLGHVPTPGFSQIINIRNWSNVKISIDENGYRNNDNGIIGTPSILAVGDSFTFGDQVSNHDTWPSCLERSLNKGVTNAGVSGYGAVQAVKRAEMILKTHHYNTVILSIYIGDDFHRDRLDYFFGYPSPSVITNQGMIEWAPLPSQNVQGSKWNPTQLSPTLTFLSYAWRYSTVAATLIDRISAMKNITINWTGQHLMRKNPNAASIDAIINFTFENLSRLPVTEKYVLFQYVDTDLSHPDGIKTIRHMATNAAQHHQIKILDSFDYLQTASEASSSPIWNGHHTAYGNQLVCQFIAENMKSK